MVTKKMLKDRHAIPAILEEERLAKEYECHQAARARGAVPCTLVLHSRHPTYASSSDNSVAWQMTRATCSR